MKDFQLHFALRDAIGEDPSWRTGITRVHGMLGQDGVYPDPNRLVTFVDNHDTDRWRSVAGDTSRSRYGIGLVMMTRGLPCLYYGTEIGMDGFAAPDGLVRDDFPGGWAEDTRKRLHLRRRNPQEEQSGQFTAALGQTRRQYRKPSPPHGPLDSAGGQYHFLRSDGETAPLVLTNASDEPAELDWNQVAPLRHRAEDCTSVLGSSGNGPVSLEWGDPSPFSPGTSRCIGSTIEPDRAHVPVMALRQGSCTRQTLPAFVSQLTSVVAPRKASRRLFLPAMQHEALILDVDARVAHAGGPHPDDEAVARDDRLQVVHFVARHQHTVLLEVPLLRDARFEPRNPRLLQKREVGRVVDVAE